MTNLGKMNVNAAPRESLGRAMVSKEAASAARGASCGNVGPADPIDEAGDGEEEGIDIPEAELDEADLPALDTDDPEALQEATDYRDLLDGGWLDRGTEGEDDEGDAASYIDVGLTIDLDGPETGEELSRVVDLDVGSLLTSLPSESAESDLDLALEPAHPDGSFALGALRDMLLPELAAERLERADEEMGDDERFPAFEDSLIVTHESPRPPDDDEGVADDDGA